MELREYLREWRREAAKERGLPAFTVMHDTSLDDLCRKHPRTLAEVRNVWGFGERKTAYYGRQILDALARFGAGARATPAPANQRRPAEDTIRLIAEGRTLEQIASVRGRQLNNIIELVAGLVERGELELHQGWVSPEKQTQIEEACARLGFERLRPLKEALPPEITFGEIRLVVARLRRGQNRE